MRVGMFSVILDIALMQVLSSEAFFGETHLNALKEQLKVNSHLRN